MNGDFRLGPWLVEPSLNTVSHNGASLRLEPKVMEVLVCLTHHAAEPTSKEQLLRTVWPGTFVSDDVLVRSISELRRALEDDSKDPKFIQTIPKRGYRLVVPVVRLNEAQAEVLPRVSIPAYAAASRRSIWFVVFAGGAILLLGLLYIRKTGGPRLRFSGNYDSPAIASLAVLPLQNLSGDPKQEYLADAMTEELITELSRISAWKVISRTSIMRYKKSDKGLPEIAQELGVDGIVEGSVLRSGDRVRVTAQLIYAPKDTNIWAETYDRDMRDVLTLRAAVAHAIASEIKVKLTPQEEVRLAAE